MRGTKPRSVSLQKGEVQSCDEIVSNKEELLLSLEQARQYLSEHLGIRARESDISNLLKLNVLVNLAERQSENVVLAEEVRSYGALIDWGALKRRPMH
jgi:hypothetical protein